MVIPWNGYEKTYNPIVGDIFWTDVDDYVSATTRINSQPKIYKTYVKDSKFICEVDLPGVQKEDVKVTSDGNLITVTGKRETPTGAYNNVTSFTVPSQYNMDDVEATLRNGVLIITVKEGKKNTIEVK